MLANNLQKNQNTFNVSLGNPYQREYVVTVNDQDTDKWLVVDKKYVLVKKIKINNVL